MVEFRIDVVIDPKRATPAVRKVSRELDAAERNAKEFESSMRRALATRDRGVVRVLRTVRTALAGLGVALVAREFLQLSDTLTNVQNRLKLVTEGTQDLANVQAELFRVANDTRSSFEGTATIFSRLAQSSEELGKTNQELLEFTESLNQAIILSGASAIESSAGLIQLSQGLASGALRGDELRSVLEQLPAVARVIARDLGIGIGQLRILGQEGKITSDIIIGAFARASAELKEDFGKTVPTIGQAFTVLNNQVLESVGAFNQATGASEALGRGILGVAESVQELALAGAVLVTGVAAVGAGFLAFRVILKPAIVEFTAAAAAQKAIAVASVEAAVAQQASAAAATLAGNAYAVGAVAARAQAISVAGVAVTATSVARQALPALAASIGRTAIAFATNPLVLAVVGFVAAREALSILKELEEANRIITTRTATVTAFAILSEDIEKLELSLAAIELRGADDLFPFLSSDSVQSAAELRDRLADLIRQRRELLEDEANAVKQSKEFQEVTQRLARQEELLVIGITKGNREREVQAALLKEIDRLVKAKLDPTAPQRAEIEADIRRNFALKDQTKILNDIRGPEEQRRRDLMATQALLDQDIIKQDEFNKKRAEILDLDLPGGDDSSLARTLAELRDQFDAAGEGATAFGQAASLAILSALASAPDLATAVERLNVLFEDGTIKADVYSATLDQLLGRREVEDLQAQIERLNEAIAKGPAEVERYLRALEEFNLQALDASRDLGDGFERAFIRIRQEAEDFASVAEASVNIFADNATDALAMLFDEGKINGKEFADSLLKDLQKVLARLLVVQLISAGAGAFGLGALNAGAQFGKTVQPGQAPLPVNEGGQEIFVPNRTGTIVPNARDVQQAAPNVNVNINIVASPTEIVRQAIRSGEVTEDIIVEFGANSDKLKQVVDLGS